MRTASRRAAALAFVAALACGGGGGPRTQPTGTSGPAQWTLVDWTMLAVLDGNSVYETCTADVALDGAGAPLFAVADSSLYSAARMFQYLPGSVPWNELGAVTTQPRSALQRIAASRTATGDPVLVRVDPTTDEIRVQRYTGGLWQDMGTPIAESTNFWLHAAAAPGGPVLVWAEGMSNYTTRGHVARWSGSDWSILGTARPMATDTGNYQLSVTVPASGDPIIAYVDVSHALQVERWDPTGLTWVSLPTPPATPSTVVEASVAVDGAGAVYLAASYLQYNREAIDAVYQLAPGASSWTSLGKPPGNGLSDSMVALRGLQGGGVFAGWTTPDVYPNGGGQPQLVRWTSAGGWQQVITYWPTEWRYDLRPRILPISDGDVWFAFNDATTMYLTRWRLGP